MYYPTLILAIAFGVVALSPADPSHAQAAHERLRVGTWNLFFFAAEAGDRLFDFSPARSRRDFLVYEKYWFLMDGAIVASQEVGELPGLQNLAGDQYRSFIEARAFDQRRRDRDIFTALSIRKTDRIAIVGAPFEIDTVVEWEDGGSKVYSRSSIALPLKAFDVPMVVVSVHLVSGCREGNLDGGAVCRRLRIQAARIGEWLSSHLASGNENLIIAGDFNRVAPSGLDDQFWDLILRPARTANVPNVVISADKECRVRPVGLDHIVAVGKFASAWIPSSTRVYELSDYERLIGVKGSDHCALSTDFDLRKLEGGRQ